MINNVLRICFSRLRGIPVDQEYAIEQSAFFTNNAEYTLLQGPFPTKGVVLSLSKSGQNWWLHNQSDLLRCTVNGSLVHPLHRVKLTNGDIIEWGLSTWQVFAQSQPTKQLTKKARKKHAAENLSSTATTTLDMTWFDRRMQSSRKDPFAFIMPTHEPTVFPNNASTALEVKSAVGTRPDQLDLLQTLHQEYQRALNEPQAQDTHPWHEQTTNSLAGISPPITSLDELAVYTAPLETLQDLVVGALKIDEVFTGLDSLRETELFQVEEPPEVLRLFATANYLTHIDQHNAAPPELTRREHHAISVDSHYHMAQHPTPNKEDPLGERPQHPPSDS